MCLVDSGLSELPQSCDLAGEEALARRRTLMHMSVTYVKLLPHMQAFECIAICFIKQLIA